VIGLLWALATVAAAALLSALAIGLWRLIDGYAFTAYEWLIDRINDALDRVDPDKDEHRDGGP
jgi:hypothetical protein